MVLLLNVCGTGSFRCTEIHQIMTYTSIHRLLAVNNTNHCCSICTYMYTARVVCLWRALNEIWLLKNAFHLSVLLSFSCC